VLNKLLYDGRMRFNDAVLLSRQDGMRKIVKAMKDGHPFYYLPDMDFGPKESIFVPFFGVQAATIPALSRLVRLTGARVVACITRQVPDGYEVEVMPPWENFPGESVEADTEFMNQFIETRCCACRSSTSGCTSASKPGHPENRGFTNEHPEY
jgi:KDO2-lipid IV(A) lauroyltransferase